MSANRHPAECTCALCARLVQQGSLGGQAVIYNLKVDPALRDALRLIGTESVRQALRDLVADRSRK